MDPARFVFLDETATATTMARRYGRCSASPDLNPILILTECRYDLGPRRLYSVQSGNAQASDRATAAGL